VTTTPDVRLEIPDQSTACSCASLDTLPQRVVTLDQVDLAVLQLRERRGRPAAEQMQAVLRALELTVAPDSEHRR